MSTASLPLCPYPFSGDESVPREHVCCSGEHTWLSAEDAARCCHPDWRRERRDIHARATLGVMYREVWVRREA